MRNVFVLVMTLALSATSALACPTCGKAKEVLPPNETSGLSGGFDASIYVLLGTVVAAMGFLGWTLFKSSAPTSKTRTTESPSHAGGRA